MPNTLSIESNNLALELHSLLKSTDPVRWRQDMAASASRKLNHIRTKLHKILNSYDVPAEDRRLSGLYEGLQSLARQLEEMKPRADASAVRMREEWSLFQRRLQPAYGSLAANLERLALPVPALRPTNYGRNAFHIASGLGTLSMVQFVLNPTGLILVGCGFALFCWLMEALRVRYDGVTRFFMIFMGKIAHPHEHHRVNSSTWYATAMGVLALSTTPIAISVGVIVLALADPAAAMVGRRFGRVSLRSGRTLEGSLAFFVVGALAAAAVLVVFYPTLGLMTVLLSSLTASLFGALTELYSGRLDDNFTIPLGSALGAALIFSLMV